MFKTIDKQQLRTLYIQCDSTIRRKTFITSCKETVQLAITLISYIYLHMLVNLKHKYIPRLSRTLNYNFQDIPGPNSFSRTY